MSEMGEMNSEFEVFAATHDDVVEMADLARSELPTFTALHDEAGWFSHNRFGVGGRVRANCTLLLRKAHELVGFVWADDAMRIDRGIIEPWWCMNALVVAPRFRARGAGESLVRAVESIAKRSGVELIYGQSVPAAISFWRNTGFTVADENEPVVTHRPARLASGELVNFTAKPGPGDRFFVKYLVNSVGSIQSGLIPMSLFRRLQDASDGT